MIFYCSWEKVEIKCLKISKVFKNSSYLFFTTLTYLLVVIDNKNLKMEILLCWRTAKNDTGKVA